MLHFARAASTLEGCLVGAADHFASQKRQTSLRRHNTCIPSQQLPAAGFKPQALRAKRKTHHKGAFFFLVAEVGFEPHGLRVMSPTSYQAAPSRDMK